MPGRLDGKRVLVTSADRYLGPAVVDLFTNEGAEVVADTTDYTTGPGVCQQVVDRAGHVDVLVANFAGPLRIMPFTNMLGPVTEAKDKDLQDYLDELVWPMTRFVRAVLPQMYERRAGKVVAIASRDPHAGHREPGHLLRLSRVPEHLPDGRGNRGGALQRADQRHRAGVHREPVLLHDEMLADPEVRASIEADIPAGRLCKGWEAAEMILSLATDASNFRAGQIIPASGGWAFR